MNDNLGTAALNALREGAKRAQAENDAIGGMGQFMRPGEHRPAPLAEPLPPPALTAAEYLAKYGRIRPC